MRAGGVELADRKADHVAAAHAGLGEVDAAVVVERGEQALVEAVERRVVEPARAVAEGEQPSLWGVVSSKSGSAAIRSASSAVHAMWS